MNDEFIAGRVLQIDELSEFVRSFRILYPGSSEFCPGQFVMLDLPIQHEFTTRSYSIASEPNNEGWIELCVVKKPGGKGSTYLFDGVQVGDHVKVSQPLGKFILEEGTEPLCFICTGTGIAPFRSMIREMILKKGSLTREVSLVFGNRVPSDILYAEEWNELSATQPNFTFIPVLSRASSEWKGFRGYVHEHYLPIAINSPETRFYICGWKEMVREAKNKLKEMGFSRKELKFELYD